MSTITANGHDFAAATRTPGAFRRAIDRIVASRQAQADGVVARHLLTLSDESLATMGHDRARLEQAARRAPAFI